MPFTYTDDATAKPKFKYADATPAAKAEPEDPYSSLVKTLTGGPKALLGIGETALQMGTGAIAKPVSDVAGLAAMGSDVLRGAKPEDRDAGGFKDEIRDRMTYQPRTEAGKAISEYNPAALLGKGVNWVGEQAEAGPEASAGRRMLGAGVHEAVNQAPGFLGMKGPPIGEAAGGALKSAARGTMQSALKPTLASLESGKAATAIDTMLDRGYNVDRGGMLGKGTVAMKERIGSLNDQVSQMVDNSLPSMVDRQKLIKSLDPIFTKYEKQIATTDDLAAIQKIHQELMNHPLISGSQIPIKLAQEMKQGTYRSIGEKAYGLKAEPTAAVDAQKAMARNLREQIEARIPKVAPLNAEASELINALSVSERRVMMEANKNLIGLGVLATSPKSFSAWMADRSGLFKSLVARMLNQGSKAAPAVGAAGPAAGIATTQGAQQAQMPPPPQGQQ